MALAAVYYAIVAWQSRHLAASEAEEVEKRSLIVASPEVVI
jgi:hypothetical protein